jgi:hypothetical protein
MREPKEGAERSILTGAILTIDKSGERRHDQVKMARKLEAQYPEAVYHVMNRSYGGKTEYQVAMLYFVAGKLEIPYYG